MSVFFLMIVVSSPVLVLLCIHIWRDLRGKARNKRRACYSCGKAQTPQELIQHHRGGSYFYCLECAKPHKLTKGIALTVLTLALAATFGVTAITKFEQEPIESGIFAATAIIIVVINAIVAMKGSRA